MIAVIVLMCIVVAVVFLVGWVMNIVKLIKLASAKGTDDNMAMFILRIIGVFVPVVGCVMGFIG